MIRTIIHAINLCLWCATFASAQQPFYLCYESGVIVKSDLDNCFESPIGAYPAFTDIAVSSNGDLYGINDRIFIIDTINQVASDVSGSISANGPFGLGLEATPHGILLFDKLDSLFSFTIATGIISYVGAIGHYCAGDFVFKGGYLYMISVNNELIKIELNSDNSQVISVTNLGLIETPYFSAYGLFNTEECNNDDIIYMVEESKVYALNVNNLTFQEHCQFSNGIYGAASRGFSSTLPDSPSIPNVITCNGDGVNDILDLSILNLTIVDGFIYNRWGQAVFNYKEGVTHWDGTDLSGEPCTEGTYYYHLSTINCNRETNITGYIQVVRN